MRPVVSVLALVSVCGMALAGGAAERKMYQVPLRLGYLVHFPPAAAPAGAPAANQWVRLKDAEIGQRACGALVYAPEVGRFLVLGGGLWWNAKGDQPYQDLALDTAEGRWENWYPQGQTFGPRFGPCQPPKFKDFYGLLFADVEGHNRVNPNAHVWSWVYGLSAYASDLRKLYFHGGGRTWSYDPALRRWEGLETAGAPAAAGGAPLLWSSMCYDAERRRLVLFGGGNVQTQRGDPGTWTCDPAANKWEDLKLEKQPPQRAHSPLCYDPVARKVILFGGDGLNALYADTWTFDGQKWEAKRPALSPSPRAGHALLWMPKSKKVVLLGGYGYDSGGGYHGQYYQPLPLEAWTYNTSEDRWDLLRRWVPGKDVPQPVYCSPPAAAVSDEDEIAVFINGQTWLCRLDAAQVDAAGTTKYGAPPGTVERRGAFYDPKWYTDGLPPADPGKVQAELDRLPVNTWVRRHPPRVPLPNMDWGSAVFLPKADVIARFSGGHCAYSGTAPHFYAPGADRWTMPFAPEFPMDHCCGDAGVPGEWSFRGNPWMPGHTWRATGSDPAGERLVYVGRAYTYFIAPTSAQWSRGPERHQWHDVRATTLCTTRDAIVAWAIDAETRSGSALYRVDAQTGAWKNLPVVGKLPTAVGFDRGGMAYDAKRDRLLVFAPTEKGHEGDVMAVDPKTGEAKWLAPAGRASAAVPARETAYLAHADQVMIGAHARLPDGRMVWPFYDCDQNAWSGAELAGDDPLVDGKKQKIPFSVSFGLVYDPNRSLAWFVNNDSSSLTALRFDAKTAGLVPFK